MLGRSLLKRALNSTTTHYLILGMNISRSTNRVKAPAVKVLAELRHGPKTVDELARALGLTGNAVRNQLRKLESENFVTRSGTRAGTSKPSTLYAITLEGQVQFSTLYVPVLTQFLRVAEGQCSGIQLESFMTQTGKSLASRYPKRPGAVRDRTRAAAALLKSFGGVTEMRAPDGQFVIRSLVCPLAALTSEQPAACHILRGLLTEYIGRPVKICCNRTEEPKCCFEITA